MLLIGGLAAVITLLVRDLPRPRGGHALPNGAQ
jgi:hypothetical protein